MPTPPTDTTALHTLALSATPAPRVLSVVVTDGTPFDSAADPRRLDDVMVWLDGRLVVQWYAQGGPPPWNGHSFTREQVDARTIRYTLGLDLGIEPIDDGDHELVVGCFQFDAGDAGYVKTTITIPPASVPAVTPGVIPRVAFYADPAYLQGDPARLAVYTAAGFNAVMSGFFQNPADNAALAGSYDAWAASNLPWFKAKLDWCRANNLMFWGTGDDFCRSPAERSWLASAPWAERAARATFALARDYPEWVAISMVDEMGGLPGDDPIFAKLVAWCRGERGPKVSWPNQWKTRSEPWEDASVADFADRYYSLDTLTSRDGRYRQGTCWQFAIEIAKTAAVTRTGQPLAFIVSGCGPYYTKRVPGDHYQEGDDLIQMGVAPEHAVLGVWLPLAYGASALRVYALDTFWAANRASDAAGSAEQTGLRLGTPEGDAMGHALRAVARYEGALLGGIRAARVVGPWLVGRRSGGFEFWCNTSDVGQECPVQTAREVITPTGPVAYSGGPVAPGCVLIR